MNFALQNVWPNNDNDGYYVHNAINDEELTVSTVGAGVFIGLQQLHQRKPFTYGSLFVDEDETILSFVSAKDFWRQVDKRELVRMIDSTDCASFPEDEDIIVARRAKRELKQLRSKFLLDAAGRNQDPPNSRPFDAMVQRESPSKGLNKWCEKFGASLRIKSVDFCSPKQQVVELASEPTPFNGQLYDSEDDFEFSPVD